jgi:hypothetical protein
MGSARESTRMQLVGSQQTISDGDVEGLQRFYGRLLDRLAKEVKHTGDVARHIGYRSALEGQHTLHFLGMEVNRIADIPPGLVAWSLGDGTWRTWEARAGRDVVISEQPIRWQWLDRKPSGHPRCTGEFATQYPTSTGSRDTSPQHDFWVSAHAYVKLQEMDASHDAVSLVDYDPSWPQQFEGMANWLVHE